MTNHLIGAILIGGLSNTTIPQEQWPQTQPELSDYRQTTHSEKAKQFIHDLQKKGAPISLQSIGKSAGGREILLAIASKTNVTSPLEAKRQNKLVIYLQANIHGGEVEGKEACLILLREIAQGLHKEWLEKCVLLVVPIYNVDGNDALGEAARNRPSQNGPDPVGIRTNADGLDLNRDAIKAIAPETQAVLKHVYNKWDPDITFDLHTTNGTRHGFALTYSPPFNPNTDTKILNYVREKLLPNIRQKMMNKYSKTVFDYGNLQNGAWYSFEPLGRYVTNYIGLRNRIGILSEATSYRAFKERIESTYEFVIETVNQLLNDESHIKSILNQADQRMSLVGEQQLLEFGVRFDFDTRGEDDVLLESTDLNNNQPSYSVNRMRIFDRFKSIKNVTVPNGFLIPPEETETIELLLRHGIRVEQLQQEWQGPVTNYLITKMDKSDRPFQNRYLITVQVEPHMETTRVDKGHFLVRMQQPLAQLALTILEPESQESVCTWGFIKSDLKPNVIFPIRKVYQKINVPTKIITPD